MDVWRVRESVDFLSLTSGRRDGEVRPISGDVGDPELPRLGVKLQCLESCRHATGRDRF